MWAFKNLRACSTTWRIVSLDSFLWNRLLGLWNRLLGGQRLNLADHVAMPRAPDEATAAGGRSCWLRSAVGTPTFMTLS